MLQTEIAITISEEAEDFYAFFIERSQDVFQLAPETKTLTLEKRDVPMEVLEYLAQKNMKELKYDKAENRIAYHGVHITEDTRLVWFNFYSIKSDVPPPTHFTVVVAGNEYTFRHE